MLNFTAPDFALEESDEGRVLRLSGDWTVATINQLDARLHAVPAAGLDAVDVSGLGLLDTSGAYLIDRTWREKGVDWPPRLVGRHASAASLLEQVHKYSEPAPTAPPPETGLIALLERTGKGSVDFYKEARASLAFLGETVVTIGRLITQPWKLRWTSIVSVMEEAGLNAMPIIAFLSFFVGMVVAFIGATTLRDFDLEIYTIELIGFSMLREFGVVLTGIVLAGRTNSSFTAQIGTMKMRQEIDAMQTLGLKPMDVLVAPRVLAMLVMTPILTFVATIAGVAGGITVAWGALDINPAVFLERMRNSVPIDQFWVGMSKSPVFGMVVALIACRQGLQVGGSVQSLGKATTTSVVQAIFAVIVLDALFAIFYMEMGI
ncbi:MlaE family lipid ABC transporter permease subunit [Hyphomonas sp. WL0036]|uniref:ABC transporter permease n=1 Tax=Hyphomonas sediminis TaxID=2866160 RepID=UPI001C81991A|nr:MlaE family lipid ABC transporter permease subunit [Hyphomonas sediminis]MBY9066646.1 MlaE family lipid ABC transporter permease subunit [Hyphomonas sediminis]